MVRCASVEVLVTDKKGAANGLPGVCNCGTVDPHLHHHVRSILLQVSTSHLIHSDMLLLVEIPVNSKIPHS